MSPLDKELHDALVRHADDVPAQADLFADVERRARGIRRRRTAAVVGGAAVLVAAVAVVVPTVLDSSRHDDGRARFAVSGSASPSATPSPSSPVVTPTDVMSWPTVGETAGGDSRWHTLSIQALNARAAQVWPGATVDRLTPLWRGVDKQNHEVVLVVGHVAGTAQAHYVAGAWVDNGDNSETFTALHDIERDPGAVSAWIDGPGPDPGTVIVVGAPGTGQISYRVPGGVWQPVEHVDGAKFGERWAAFPRALVPTPGQVVDQVQVLDGNGDLGHPLYQGAIGRGITFPDV